MFHNYWVLIYTTHQKQPNPCPAEDLGPFIIQELHYNVHTVCILYSVEGGGIDHSHVHEAEQKCNFWVLPNRMFVPSIKSQTFPLTSQTWRLAVHPTSDNMTIWTYLNIIRIILTSICPDVLKKLTMLQTIHWATLKYSNLENNEPYLTLSNHSNKKKKETDTIGVGALKSSCSNSIGSISKETGLVGSMCHSAV